MKHISHVIAEMIAAQRNRAGVENPTVDGAAIVAQMEEAGELRFLDRTEPHAKATPKAQRQARKKTT
jgi:molybdopterin biosynthesis enzyme